MFPRLHVFSNFVDYHHQLGLTEPLLLEPCCSSNSMLELAKCLVKLDATMYSSTLHKTHASDIGRSFAASDLSPFLKMGDIFASFQIWGSFPESTDFWKITCSMGASSAWRVCRTMGLNWSGSAALWGFRDLSSFSMPFTKICISGICLYELDWKGKLHPWSFSSWSFRWAKELKRSGDLELKRDWNCLFRAFLKFLTVVREGPSVRLQWGYTTWVLFWVFE